MDATPASDRRPAVLIRLFGWLMLAGMVAFLSNVALTFYAGFTPIGALYGTGPGADMWAWLQAALYVALPAAAALNVLRTRRRSLREDALAVTAVNAFIVRAAFWAVLLVGVADMAVSFLRVEGLLPGLFGTEIADALARSNYRGTYVHFPALALGVLIACFSRSLGFHWLALLVVVAELLIVFSRFVFSYEQAFMADLVRLWYAALFLFASAYTLLEDGHVRVDVFYATFTRRNQGKVNAWGAVLLGMTVCWVILVIGFWDRTSIINAPLLVFETTLTGFGMYVKYLMAAFLGIFAITMQLQFVASLFESVADMRGDPGGHEDHHVSHIA
jgi:TRAP-type mannitol/chloroaromatic compound transport system permease small subunit